jgi:hypothetical protein
MPKTNRRRTTHRKRTSQRKRKNAKKGVLHNMRGGVSYNKYVMMTDTEKGIKSRLTFLSFEKQYPTVQEVADAFITQIDNTIRYEDLRIYGENGYQPKVTGDSSDNPIKINILRNDASDRYIGYGM